MSQPPKPSIKPASPFDWPRVGVAVLVRQDGKILVGLRRSATHGDGVWQLPGGHLEWSEDVEACAAREVLEETGLDIRVDGRGPWSADYFPESGRHYVTVFILATVIGGIPEVREPDKCERWEWFDWTALPEPMLLPLASIRAQGYDPFA